MKKCRVVFRGHLRYTLLVYLLNGLFVCVAQVDTRPYRLDEQVKIASGAMKALKGAYLINLNNLTHYERNQPPEALEVHVNGTIRDAFQSAGVLIFNEFRPVTSPYSTFSVYVGDCRVHSSGFALQNTLGLDTARFQFGRTLGPEKSPYVNVYVVKRIEAVDPRKSPVREQHLVEIRLAFQEDRKQGLFHTFRIAGIERTSSIPTRAMRVPIQYTPPPIDLTTVAQELIQQISTSLPKGTQEVAIDWFTYRGEGTTNDLSDRIYAALNTQFPTETGHAVAVSPEAETPLRLRGIYEENDLSDKLVVTARLVRSDSGRILAEARNSSLPLSWLAENKLELIPDKTTRPPAPPKVVLSPAEFKIEIRSDRGREVIEYWEGDRMTYSLKATRPCYARVLSLQSDGAYVLLEENIRIRPGQENQDVPVLAKYDLTVGTPFGTEYLLVYASEKPMRPLPREPKTGGYVRREGDQDIFVGSAEAIVRLSASTEDGTVAQDKIQITTRAKRKAK